MEMESGRNNNNNNKVSEAVVVVTNNNNNNTNTSRWNPTKEQISILEGLYKQGIRTPNAEQIQNITSRLKAFGHIEGKNVFYWFQNHKARQRQKQKQESLAYFNSAFIHHNHNKFLHHHHPVLPPVFASPPPNVLPGPYYLQQRDNLGFYPPHQSKILLPSGNNFKRSQIKTNQMEKARVLNNVTSTYVGREQKQEIMINATTNNTINQETLPLFPLNPTGILQERAGNFDTSGSSSLVGFLEKANDNNIVTCAESEEVLCDKPFFDFFSVQGRF